MKDGVQLLSNLAVCLFLLLLVCVPEVIHVS